MSTSCVPAQAFTPAFYAIVPAAGSGQRLPGQVPKQYRRLGDALVIEHAIKSLVSHPHCQHLTVALAADDAYWHQTAYAKHPSVSTCQGGVQRMHSVFNALQQIDCTEDAWILVHDAARPCLLRDDLDKLLAFCATQATGAVLGAPAYDSMKHCNSLEMIEYSVAREGLWHAFTPQVFRYGVLRKALTQALAQGLAVTDEASAVEQLALPAPVMVAGAKTNIKITDAADLALAELILAK